MNRDERRAWGPLIRAAREAQGLKQEDLADQARTSRRTLGSIERGDSVAQHDVLSRLLDVLGLTPRRLDDDIEAFMAMLGPLLQMLTVEQRLAVMPEVMQLVARALSGADPNVHMVIDEGAPMLGASARTPQRVESD
jgi:transcriptional regulator with XRE-family HTH domain